MRNFLFCLWLCSSPLILYATGISDDFDDGVLAAGWNPTANYALNETGGELIVSATNAGPGFETFNFEFASIDLSGNPVLTIDIRSDVALDIRMDLQDSQGRFTNADPEVNAIPGTGAYNSYTFDFGGKFNQEWPGADIVDPTDIVNLVIFFNPGGAAFTGDVFFDNLVLGTGGPTDGGGGGSPVSLTTDIRLNQIGFYTNCHKLAVVKDAPAGPFYITSPDAADTAFTGVLGDMELWNYSDENVRVADFSDMSDTTGEFVLIVPGMGRSHRFQVNNQVHHELNKASLKAYYFNRSSTELLPEYAGVYARAAGHPDNNVSVHWSAESPARPEGTTISSPKGWYDAGDYGKYIVNSGISTYTLMAAYEHFPEYYDTLEWNIPESGNALPDILDEVLWNVEWMLTMQEPFEGFVYHKLTPPGFPGVVMPADDGGGRLVIGKGTAAALNFAAVMAQASRVFANYPAALPGFADQCLDAAVFAWNWARNNPADEFHNPGGITSGEYGGNENPAPFDDEFYWAGMELYITTQADSFYTIAEAHQTPFIVPQWTTVNTLGLLSLVAHRDNLTPIADVAAITNNLLTLANTYRNEANANSAYRVPMGTNANDFVWGSNSFDLNQGMVLIGAYLLTDDINYHHAAVSSLDYVLGRNATTYSFVTGHGSFTPMDPHHRPSAADGIPDPVPGFIAGGPQSDNTPDGCAYPSALPALRYVDDWCSYSTNEVTINWNAPLAYVSGALEVLKPCQSALPVDLLYFDAHREGSQVKLVWATVTEKNSSHFVVQRSADAKQFESIGKVTSAGNSDRLVTYSFNDPKPTKGINYYRLVQADHDGQKTTGKVVAVDMGPLEEVVVYPNPSSGVFHVQTTTEEEVDVVIYDLNGGIVRHQTLRPSDPFGGDLSAGFYMVRISSRSDVHWLRIIKQ